jgi:hypothetical protein
LLVVILFGRDVPTEARVGPLRLEYRAPESGVLPVRDARPDDWPAQWRFYFGNKSEELRIPLAEQVESLGPSAIRICGLQPYRDATRTALVYVVGDEPLCRRAFEFTRAKLDEAF